MGNTIHANATWKRRRWIILACSLAALGSMWAFLPKREPSYSGRSLSYWLSVCASGHYGWSHPQGEISILRRDEAEEALRKIGPDAVPYLVKRMEYQPTKLKTQFVILMGKLDGGSLGWCIPESLTRDGGTIRAGEAELGFKVLGSSARAAVPSLAKLCGRLHDLAAAQRPLRALTSIGPDAFDAVIGVMTNQQSSCQEAAILMTLTMGTNACHAAPALLYNLQLSNDDIAYASLFALREVVPPSNATLSALSNFLQSPNPQLRGIAASSLESLGARGYIALTNGPTK